MFPYNYLIAAALLVQAPQETIDPVTMPSQEMFADVHEAMQNLAVDWEILDPRECRYILEREKDFYADLNLLRKRYQELADAPPLNDCWRFPSRPVLGEYLTFNRGFQQHLNLTLFASPARTEALKEMIVETERIYQILDKARDTQCEYYYITVRRYALKSLKEAIGDNDFYNGQLPDHIPFWRFREIE